MKIRDLVVGGNITITLLTKSSDIKQTKAGKPYLWAEFTDGTDSINGVDWDYGDGPALKPNTIWDVSATVTEWSGVKQLKIIRLRENTERSVTDFAPQGPVDIRSYVDKWLELANAVEDHGLKEVALRVFEDFNGLWCNLPSAKGVHHAYVGGQLKHSVDVAIKSKALAHLTPMANVDLCVVGGLLHDFGKLWTYKFNGAVIEMTEEGQMIEHIMLGAIKLEQYRNDRTSGAIDLLQHIISSHHGQLEYGSPTTPLFLEAFIVSAADGLDAKANVLIEQFLKTPGGNMMTDKIFVLGNRQVFTPDYIRSKLS